MPGADACPCCGSALVQPLRWRELDGECLELRLRCPECESCFAALVSVERAREVDLRRLAGREALAAAYDALVRESMSGLADALGAALAADLITADDFGPRPAAP